MQEYSKFTLWLGIFSILVAAVLYFFIPSLPARFIYDGWWKILLFFTGVTAAFHYGLLISTKKRPASVTIYYMASTTIKLLLFAGIMVTYSMLNKDRAAGFIVAFFLMYFFYTVFEVSILYRKFSTPVKKDPA